MNEIAVRPPLQEVCEKIASPDFAKLLKQALPANVTVDRFTRVTLTAVQQNPDLVGADRRSLFNSVIRCAQDGLLPNGKEAALVMFYDKQARTNKVQYLPMIGGYRKRLAEHGITLSAYVVYERDEFDYELGTEPTLKHKPVPLGDDRGEPLGAYAMATDRNGRLVSPPEVMDKAEIERVRAVSRAATSAHGPWVNWWTEQARKTVARRLFKQLPLRDIDGSLERLVDGREPAADFGAMGPGEYATYEAVADLPLPDSLGGEPATVGETADSLELDATDEASAGEHHPSPPMVPGVDGPVPPEESQTAFPIPAGARPKRRRDLE